MKRSALWSCIVLLGGCSSQSQNTSMLDERVPIAKTFEQQQRLADALTQWRILRATFPNDPEIESQVNRIEALISAQLSGLFEQLDAATQKGNEQKIRTVYLKILALQPNNQVAKQKLRDIEWSDALDKADKKTEVINQYFAVNQQKAQRAIQLNKMLEQAQQFTQDKKYNGLLQLAEKFEVEFPDRQEPTQYRLLAYTKLAERSVDNNAIEEAIPLFEKAIAVSQGKNKNLVSKTARLKKNISDQYLSQGVKSFKTDLDKAIELFTLSLEYQPENKSARQQLKRATTVRDNLNRIKKLNASSN